MIEDALKSTRTLHRLIMTVALVTIVFSLSISLPKDKAAQKEIIDGLIAIDFSQYDAFVSNKIERETTSTLVPIGEEVTKAIEAENHLVFNVDKIGDAFKSRSISVRY